MRQFVGIILVLALLFGINSCVDSNIKKPDKLIPKEDFLKMMVDVYLVSGLHIHTAKTDDLKKVTSTDLYYSVLKKYNIPDTVFIRSLVYYSSFPKEYEKMHVEILNRLNESQERFKPTQKLDLKEE